MSTSSSSAFLDIDPMRLDEEWLKQPKLYFEWATKLADARQEMDNAKTQIDIVRATADRKIRRHPDRFGLPEKPTESSISAKVNLDEAVQEANAAYNEARHTVDIAQAAVTALEHRKRALTMLVELHSSNYYAEPKLPSSSAASGKMGKADVLQRTLARKTALRREQKGED